MCNKVSYVSRKDARSAARWMERRIMEHVSALVARVPRMEAT